MQNLFQRETVVKKMTACVEVEWYSDAIFDNPLSMDGF